MNGSRPTKELEALRYVRNAVTHGRSPSVRELQKALDYRSPRSAAEILNRLITQGFVARRSDGRLQLRRMPTEDETHARTVEIPLVGTAPCGAPLLAIENVEAMIPVSIRLARPPHRYFILRASGDSMDKSGIKNGDLVLVRQQSTAMNGDRVVALVDDEASIKEFRRKGDTVVLLPRSSNPKHQPIVLDREFQVQGVVINVIPNFKKE